MLRVALLALVMGGCASQAKTGGTAGSVQPISTVGAESAQAQHETRRNPLMDHHQHLLSPAAAKLEGQTPMPAVDVPAAVAELLRDRAAFSADASQLSKFFTDEAFLLGTGNSGWKRGAQTAADHISSNFSPGYRLTPVLFRIDGETAQVAGYYTRGEGASLRHPGYFSMGLAKGPSGKWQIASETPAFPGPTMLQPIDGENLVNLLDAGGIKRAIVLSNAYYFDGLIPVEGNPHNLMRAENDWTAGEISRFPSRLVGFCSFNPLADYALAELHRCSRELNMKGLKVHFGTSGVDALNPEHVTKLRAVFEAANRLKMPILAHLTASRDYGRKHSEVFLRQLVPAAPDVPIVIAHLWGGAGYADEALAVFADAVAARDPLSKNLFFDVTQASLVEGKNDENLNKIATRMRQIGMERVLYGSDGPYGNGLPPKQMWADFQVRVPLSPEEFQQIARNVLPGLDRD